MLKLALLFLATLSAHASELFPEQVPLQMTTPNISKEQPTKWIPLSPNSKEAGVKNTSMSDKGLNELIKTQVQKKMQSLLKPLADDQDEH